MTRPARCVPTLTRLLLLAIFLVVFSFPVSAQQPEFDALASHVKSVVKDAARFPAQINPGSPAPTAILFPLLDSEGRVTHFGVYASNELFRTLKYSQDQLPVLNGAFIVSTTAEDGIVLDDLKLDSIQRWLALKTGAHFIANGSYALTENHVTIHLKAFHRSFPERARSHSVTISRTAQLDALLSQPPIAHRIVKPLLKSRACEGISKTGTNGTTFAECLDCPDPTYSEKASRAKLTTKLTLAVTVTKDGSTQNIEILHGAPLGLDQQAIEAVKKWKFKPSAGPDGQPVDTCLTVEVFFRIL